MSSRRTKRARPKAVPRVPATFGSLPEPALHNIARCLESQACPLWDKQDLLRTAATLSMVGNKTATALAHAIFKLLSPRLGQRLPGGVTADSPLGHLQLAAKTWGLSMSGKTKQDVYQNLLDQVQDSERDAQGRPPKHCLVSAATRRELSAWGQKRVTITKAKEVFGLERYDLIGLDMEERKMGAFFTQTFSLKELKERAIELLPTRSPEQQAALLNGYRLDADAASAAAAAAAAAAAGKKGAVCGVLQQRGYPPARVEALLSQPGAFRLWEQSYPESRLPPEEAALALERWFFLVQGHGQPHFMQALAANADWEPPGSSTAVTAAADAAHARRMRAMESALPEWLATQRNLMFILGNPEVPRSMLPELQRMWAEREQAQQAQQAPAAQQAQPQSQPVQRAQQAQQGQRPKPHPGQKGQQGQKQGQKRKPKQQGGPADKR